MDSPGKEWFLNKALRIDDDVAEALYSKSHRTHLHEIPDYPLKNNYNGATPVRLYFWMEPDSGWARFWPEYLSQYSESPDSLFGA